MVLHRTVTQQEPELLHNKELHVQRLGKPEENGNSNECNPGYKNEPMLLSFQLVIEIYNQIFSGDL